MMNVIDIGTARPTFTFEEACVAQDSSLLSSTAGSVTASLDIIGVSVGGVDVGAVGDDGVGSTNVRRRPTTTMSVIANFTLVHHTSSARLY